MTEPGPEHPHAIEPAPEIVPPAEDGEPRRAARPGLLPWLCALGFLLLAGAIAFVWHDRPDTGRTMLADQLRTLESRVAQLEQKPQGAPDTADTTALTARVTALEQRQGGELAPLQARIAAVERKTGAENPLAARMDALSGRVEALSGKDSSADAQLGQRLDAAEARLSALEHAAAQATAEVQRATRLIRIQSAQSALATGQPLGDLAGAPPEVARFATAAPPTEAALRLAFPEAEAAALAASRPDTEGRPFLSRVLARAEDLVTVRQGDRVVVGDRAAGVLARARTALDAGDLAGAVAAVSALSGPAADAIAAWRGNAKALLDARTALAGMAAHP